MALYDKKVILQKLDTVSEEWENHDILHAKVNKTGGGVESYNAGASQYHVALTFEFRYIPVLAAALKYNTQEYQLIYQGQRFNIIDYDDYMEQHQTIRLTGEAYG